jgi:hypothetical protein
VDGFGDITTSLDFDKMLKTQNDTCKQPNNDKAYSIHEEPIVHQCPAVKHQISATPYFGAPFMGNTIRSNSFKSAS